MNVWSSKICRLMLTAAIVLTVLSPTPNTASGAGTRTRNDLNQTAPSVFYPPDVSYPHRPSGSVDHAIAPSSPSASTDAEPVAEVTAPTAPAKSLALDLGDDRAEVTAIQAAATFISSLALDGDGDFVWIPHDDALNDYTHLTIEAWVRRSSDDRCETIISKGLQTDYWLGFCNRTLRFYLAGTYYEGNTAVPANVWTNVAVVWRNYASPYVVFYINGQWDGSASTSTSPSKSSNFIHIGSNPETGDLRYFAGNIAEVRLWSLPRAETRMRRTMHVALKEPLPGLIANWHLTEDYKDNIGGHDGTPYDNASLDGPQAPPQPAVVPIDENFNELPGYRSGPAAVYIPSGNRALVIGGSGSSLVYSMDAGTGETTALDAMPGGRSYASVAYVPDNDLAYLFGGRFSSTSFYSSILAIDPDSGYTRTLTATLPTDLEKSAAVFHPGTGKVYVIGGGWYDSMSANYIAYSSIKLFDPVLETAETLSSESGLRLPAARYGLAAAYSSATDKIYVFGGRDSADAATDTIYEVTVAPDGETGSVTAMTSVLPQPTYGLSAIEDPHTQLIYLLGGGDTNRVLVFDPVTSELWETPIEVEERSYAGAVFSPLNRHALLIGGISAAGFSKTNVWRIPLGDGPAVPLGHWDFPTLLPGEGVSAIDGDEDHVLIGTNTNGVWRYDEDRNGLHYTLSALGSASGRVHDVHYDAGNQWVWITTDDAGARLFDGDSDSLTPLETYDSSDLGTNNVGAVDVKPGARSIDGAPFFGTWGEGLKWQSSETGPWTWKTNFAGNDVTALDHRSSRDLWAISSGFLAHLAYNQSTGSATQTTYDTEAICGVYNIQDLVFDPEDNWWIASTESEFNPGGVCFIPAADPPGTDNNTWSAQDPVGDEALDIDVDADGRVWVAFRDEGYGGRRNGESGGLAVWETGNSSRLRTEEYNWDDAPVGGNISDTVGLNPVWESGITAVGAVDERVWAGTSYEGLVTLAQRWQQLDESNELDIRPARRLWTVRGRLFLASYSNLYVLMPDGRSWDNRLGVRTDAVFGDSRGRIWVGTSDGVRRYTATGWDMLTGTVGTPPTSTVYALAEDLDGRIWIGGEGGLTLFDRERFVATFTAANSDLPTDTVKALLVDRQDRLWVGTTAGLARLDNDESPWVTYTTANGLAGDAIHDLAQRGDGIIAATTDGGLSYYMEEPWNIFWTFSEPIDTTNAPLTVDELGRLWAGSAVWTGGRWQSHYWTNSGLRSTTISDNAADGADRVWFSHAPEGGVSVRGAFLPPLANVVPDIDDVNPRYGTSGREIDIVGSGFGDNPSDVSVTIGGASAEVTSVSGERITVLLDDDNVSGDVSVSVDGRRTTWTGGSFCAVPQIRELSPTGGNAGVTVHIRGSNFDPEAQVFIGDASIAHPVAVRRTPTHIELIIQSDDGNGRVRVENRCHDDPDDASDTSGVELRHITLGLRSDHVFFNQGIPSYPLVTAKPTWVRYYLTHSEEPRDTDVMQVSEVEITFTNPDSGDSRTYTIPHEGTFTTTLDAPPPAWLLDTSPSLNVILTPYGLDALLPDGGADLEMSTILKGDYSAVVAQASGTVHFKPNLTLRVMLVPIMPTGFTQTLLITMTNHVDRGLDELRRRIMPMGRVDFIWSDTVVTRDDPVDIGDWVQLWEAGHDIQEIRSAWNSSWRGIAGQQVLVAFGVVHQDLQVAGSESGMAFWADLSEGANVILDFLDDACEVTSLIINGICMIFGGECGWECEVDVPLYVGWADGNNGQVSALFGHEFGHIFGLVKAMHANGSSLFDNYTHSVNDELDGGECDTLRSDAGATYNVDRTLYRQPGVDEPVLDPVTVRQWWPNLSDTRTLTFTSPTTYSVTSEAFVDRGKAIMSYACETDNDKVFFEPVDLVNMYVEFGFWDISGWYDFDSSFSAASAAPTVPERQTPQAARPRVIPGQRLHVSGVVSKTSPIGQINRVKAVGEELPLSLSFASGYWLVQLDSDDNELSRIGIYPLFKATNSDGFDIEQDTGFFAATLLRQEGMARIELQQGDAESSVVLDTFSAGSTPPSVTVTSPTGGVYSSGTIPVTWTASDADGDPLRITIEYSAAGAAAWTPVALSEGSGTVEVPVYQLAGSDEAHFRVTASDGFNSASATSAAFQVSDQPPRPYIGHPTAGATFLEGEQVILSGSANDKQDITVADTNLSWSSDRDGELGTGSELSVFLSAGDHTLTLEAENSAGLTATTNVTMTIVGDYDYDGIPDDEELTDGLNPLTTKDAYSDADGDGLPLIMELRRGLDPDNPDSDGDGRDDADEIVAGTDPMLDDAPLPPDELEVFPKSLTFEGDLSLDTPMPQQQVQVVSREPATWTLTSDVTWLAASAINGTTLAGPTILVKAFDLEEGVHTGVLTFTSAALGSVVTVPVTATITNAAAYFDTNSDNCVNVGDVQDVAGRIPSDIGQEGFHYRRDADRDGDVDAADALLMAQRWTTERDICSASYPTAASVVRVSAPASVAVDTVFTAGILIGGPQNLGGFEFDLAFDPAVLQVQGAALGDLLGSTGRTSGDLGPIMDNTAGTIAFGGYTYGEPSGVSSDGELAQITFRAIASGNSTLDIQNPLLADPSGGLTLAADQDASVGVTEGYEIYLPLVLRNQ